MAESITFLTDYGTRDEFVGVCHGVIAGISPDSRIFDISHDVPRHDVRGGALLLRRTLDYFPARVHLAVVDPGVGAQRRAIAVRTVDEDRIFVGPDNGLLSIAARKYGGAAEVVDISTSPFRLQPTSSTFHGRDIFAPVTARLAAGASLTEAGTPLDPDELVDLEMPMARAEGDELIAHALSVDSFGNVSLDLEHEELAGFGLRLGLPVKINGSEGVYTTTFADAPEGGLLIYEDPYRSLALAVNRGSAAEQLGIDRDDEVRIQPA
ncbi:MAG: SAM-dependent chlorinase/fluorinase [Solirubrobacteraceae bacterium]|nr:SAM-dependent chlorinase/fluorinase [Solirubrobacteraceae bacterium]